MAQLKIPLAPNESTLRKEDLSRAMFCALSISQEDDVKEVKNKLQQHPDLQFEEIHISVPNLDGEPIQKFVVASAEDIIFIAFQGMVTPTDFIISDLQFDEQLGVNFHKGFFTRSNASMAASHLIGNNSSTNCCATNRVSSFAGTAWAGLFRTWFCYVSCSKVNCITPSL